MVTVKLVSDYFFYSYFSSFSLFGVLQTSFVWFVVSLGLLNHPSVFIVFFFMLFVRWMVAGRISTFKISHYLVKYFVGG